MRSERNITVHGFGVYLKLEIEQNKGGIRPTGLSREKNAEDFNPPYG